MTEKENYLRTVRFEYPDHIPVFFCINAACYDQYPQEELFGLMEEHKLLFPGFKAPKLPYRHQHSPIALAGKPFRDDFGCIWETPMDGLTGTVTGHPLENWDSFKSWTPPDPEICCGIGPVNWAAEKERIQNSPDKLHMGGLRHGHTFLQLSDLRGYQNLIFDMVDEEPLLFELIDKVEQFNMEIIRHYIDCGVDIMTYAEDLGMQSGPMLSPDHFRKYIKPSYERLIRPAKEKGIPIHMHSDGDIRTLVDDLIDGGVEVINLQDLVNGVDWIAGKFAGKVCVDLDIDRQNITCFGTPDDIEALIRKEISSIGRKEGGLMLTYGLYPGTPLKNTKALMDTLEQYMGYFR